MLHEAFIDISDFALSFPHVSHRSLALLAAKQPKIGALAISVLNGQLDHPF
jgi:hypothetical protein